MDASVEITPELLAGFIDEGDEYLTTLSDLLMQLEDEAAAGPISFAEGEKLDLMNVMFRAAHSLKGMSGAFGFAEMNALNHRMETLFDEARMGNRMLDSRAIEVLLTAQGVIQNQVEELKNPTGAEIDVTDAMNQLQAIIDAPKPGADESGSPTEPTEQTTQETADTSEPQGENPPEAARGVPANVLDDPELRSIFIETTEEDIEKLSQQLLKIEEAADEEVTTEAFRIAHTIKGACGAAGLPDAHELTHRMETLLDQLRNGTLAVGDELMSTLLAVADRLREVVEEVKKDCYSAWPQDKVEQLFANWEDSPTGSAGSQNPTQPTPTEPATPGELFDVPAGVLDDKRSGFAVKVEFDPDNPESALQPFLIHNKLNDLGVVVYSDPDMDKDTGENPISMLVAVVAVDHACEEDSKQLQQLLTTFEVTSAAVRVLGAPGDVPAAQEPTKQEEQRKQSTTAPAEGPATKAQGPPAQAKAGQPAKKATTAQKATVVQETVRVDVDRLDHLMNLGGELVINRSQFSQIEKKFKDIFEGKDQTFAADDIAQRLQQLSDHICDLNSQHNGVGKAIGELVAAIRHDYESVRQTVACLRDQRPTVHSLSEAVNTLGRVSDTLQKQIMGTRMVPVGPLFSRFKRVVRDIAKNQGKKIDYQIEGEHTELDKKMIDELGDPLTHMIRNSVDHGIELPEDRVKAGKDATGVLKIEAYHQGNSICIRLSDDGKGVDVEAVRKKILEKELVTEAQANQLTDKELVQYIFHPGMSTAKTVSDVSGRGMGMDIVMSKISNLNGTVDVESIAGSGTTVTIKLPLTLAIITSLLSRIGSEVYAIPLEAVSEIVTVKLAETSSVQGKRVITVRGHVIPILLLEQLLEMGDPELLTRTRTSEEWTLVILGTGEGCLGLVVDELIGQEDIVIKSLADNYQNVPGLVGATIMGDGRIALILDPMYLQDGNNRRPDEPIIEQKEVLV